MPPLTTDPRLPEAKSRPIWDVWSKLGEPTKLSRGTDRAGPCPDCGGRDRFHINTQRNYFSCRKCGAAGDQIRLVMLVKGLEFPEALTWIAGDRQDEISPEERDRRALTAQKALDKQRSEENAYRLAVIKHAKRIWAAAKPAEGTQVEGYLEARGIHLRELPKCLRFIPDHPYVRKVDGRNVRMHSGPCMIAAIKSPAHEVTCVHQTWIDLSKPKAKAEIIDPETGEVQKSKLTRGSLSAGAIRLISSARLLTGDGGVMVVGEGIETVLSFHVRRALPGASFWAGVSLGHMSGKMRTGKGLRYAGLPRLDDEKALRVPRGLSRLIFLQDGDSDPRMTPARLMSGLRRAEHFQPGLPIQIVRAEEGADFNDMLMGAADG